MKIGVGTTKALSLLIVWCMVCSAFAGMLVLMVPGAGQALSPSEVNGDVYIGQDFTINEWQVSGNSPISGDLVIRAGGVVIVTNGQLTFLNYDGHINKLVVEDGGQLIMINSTLKVQRELYDYDYALGVLVRNGGLLYAEDSNLDFNGHLLVDDATLIAHRTVINGPLFTAMSADVQLYDSEMTAVPGRPMLEEETYSYSFATAANQSVDVTYLFERNPDTVSTGQDVSLIQMNDSGNVTLASTETLTVTGFDIGGLVFDEGEALSVVLKAEYRTADDFDDEGAPDTFGYAQYQAPIFTAAANMQVWETYDLSDPVEANKETVISQDLTVLSLSSIDLSVLSVRLINTKDQNVFIDRIWIEVELEMPAFHNINIAGMSKFTAVNTLLEVNHLNYTDYYLDEYEQMVFKYRKLVAYDAAEVNLYGVVVEGEFFDDGEAPYVINQRAISFKPLAQGPGDTTAEPSVYGLQSDEGAIYYINVGATLQTNAFLTGGLNIDFSSVFLEIEYSSGAGYSATDNIQWNMSGYPLIDTGIIIDITTGYQHKSAEFPKGSIVNSTQLSDINLEFVNPGAGSISIDWLWLTGILDPAINIYRWINATVVDSNNLPVMGATVNATQSLNGLPATYIYDGAESTVPPQGVLDYLGRNATSFKITDISGQALIPLLTDVINADWAPNSYAVPGYNLSVDYLNASAEHFVPGPIYSWFDAYPIIGEEDQSMDMLFMLEELELDLPDVQLLNFSTDPAIVYQGDEVTFYFQVTNNGLTTASSFIITVVDSIGVNGTELGVISVTNLLPGETRDLSLVWLDNYTTPGTHSIVITADALNQVMEYDENNVLTAQVQVLKYLPDLMVDGTSISFSSNPGVAQQEMLINVTVSNINGRAVAQGAVVRYYLGNPSAGGVLIGSSLINVATGGTNVTSLMWTPVQIGTYPIYVTVNEGRQVEEYDYSNNVASSTLVVILEGSTNDLVVDYTSVIPNNLLWQTNIIVEGEGHLTLANMQLYLSQISTNKPIQIVVRDNGTLVLDSSVVDSNFVLRIYLFDNGSLILSSSTLRANVVLIIDDNSMAHMEESFVLGDLQAPATSSAELVAINTTFSRAWSYFGGISTAELTGCSINGVPAVSPKDGAVVTLYSWIVASVYDGTGQHKIPGAYVEARSFVDQTVYAVGTTDDSGAWRFRALSDVITASGHGSVVSGYYELNATHWFLGDRYDSDVNKVAQIAYSPDVPLVRSDAAIRLDISSALPDVDPPFFVSNDEPLRGRNVTLSTVINNIGVVTAYDILIRFEDTSSAGKVLVRDYLIEELPALSNVTVSVIWVATYPLGTHNLSVTVDPLGQIPELNEDNNLNYTTVNVLGVPDLIIQTADITVNPTSPIRDKAASISVNVRNIGDNAISAFNVSFYDDGDLIGKRQINNLPTGQTGVVTQTWTPTSPGTHVLTVEVDEEGIITESNEANNLAAMNVAVRDYPDLVASSVRFTVGGVGASSAFVNSEVTVLVDVYNVGESPADPFSVAFWLNEEELIDVVTVSSLGVGGLTTVSTTWTAAIVAGEGLYQDNNIMAIVNPASNSTVTHISEMDDPANANNWASQTLEVVDNRPDMAAFNGRVQYAGQNITSATIGQKVFVLFDLRNIGIIDGTDIKVSVSLVNETIDMLLFTQTVNVEAGDSMPYNVSYVVNVTSGDYTFVVDVDAGSDSDQADNVLDIDLAVVVPSPLININLGNKFDYAPGTSIFVQGTVTQSGSNAPLAGQTVKVRIVDSQGFPLSSEYATTTNANGQFTSWVLVPSGKEGTQSLEVTVVTLEGEFSDDVDINIVAPFAPETIPSWVYLLIVAIVIAVIVIFSLYLYRVGLGRMVECGNCGALIPEASRHCPKCGVEFESDTAKCSECGAWIPSKAESCPDCGAKFMTEPVETGQAPGYIESMRKQYDEYIEAFRGQAKAALGSKYSEEKFMEWLQTEPNYLPFEEWLRKEEMSRRSGVFPCPACGTLNPRDSKICNRCGTVFDQQGKSEAPKAEEKKSPFRRIVRRTGDQKDAPKEQAPEASAEPKSEESGDKPQ
ncbi:MAG: CARDB domain-containing protein [Methanomassiliicoccales archaeon]